MASKKYSMAVGLLCLAASAFAQEGGSYDWRDSSKIPAKRLPQHNEFLNNQYAFPAKPKDMWELGLHGGYYAILGDMAARPGFGGGISLRKALGHVISIRGEYTGSYAYGMDYKPRTGNDLGGIWAKYYGNNRVYANYRTRTHALSLDMLFSLNTIKFYSDKVKTNFYLLAGYTFLAADVDVDALDGNGNPYISQFAAVDNNASRKDIYKEINNFRDKKYENNAPSTGNRAAAGRYQSNQLLRHAADFGAGIAFKLSPKVNLGLEQKFVLPFGEDYLDGVSARANNTDVISYTNIRLNFDLGNKSKRVAPLWWWNPLDYAYNELNAPKHMKLPKPVLDDADGDGVTDQFDKEPNTPAGAPVDSHGVARDTDGDGVPDYKDKELITPTQCQPVDADGVGKCPDPECCKNIQPAPPQCNIGSLPSVTFKGKTASLNADAKSLLVDVAAKVRSNPACKIAVSGHPAANKAAQALNQKRVDAIIKYLVEKEGIGNDRVEAQYDGGEGDVNTVEIKSL